MMMKGFSCAACLPKVLIARKRIWPTIGLKRLVVYLEVVVWASSSRTCCSVFFIIDV